MKIVSTIEARMASTRLPSKTMKGILGRPMLELLIERLERAKTLDQIIIATTKEKEDNCIINVAKRIGIAFFRGSSEDVLDRVLEAAKTFQGDLIVEMTSDCPLLDPELIDRMVRFFLENDFDYVGNTMKETFPQGSTIRIFTTKTLEEISRLTDDPFDRENVSLYIYQHPERFRLHNIEAPLKHRHPEYRWTIDHEEDLRLVRRIYGYLYPENPTFSTDDIIELMRNKPELAQINAQFKTRDPI